MCHQVEADTPEAYIETETGGLNIAPAQVTTEDPSTEESQRYV